MTTSQTAHESLEFLWSNYRTLCETVDLEAMPRETFELHLEANSSVRPFRIATWFARQGFFIAAWVLWEHYARGALQLLSNKEKKRSDESTVEWVRRSLAANGINFGDSAWFSAANCVRNLIAHNGTRIESESDKKHLERAHTAFSKLDIWADGYLNISHEHVADLYLRIETFISETVIT